MPFASFSFLLFFLPGVAALSFLPAFLQCENARVRCRNTLLLAVNLFFYAWGDLAHLPLLLISVGITYSFGRLIAGAAGSKRHAYLIIGLVITLFPLLYYKYLPLLPLPPLSLFASEGLPLGISFYTFSSVSYLSDIHLAPERYEKSPLFLSAYLTFFPTITAGPITTYRELQNDLHKVRSPRTAALAAGISRFVAGLTKKLLLADSAGALFAALAAKESLGAVGAWLALFAFAFRIYYDFSGYSDMAIGIGKMLGFTLPENFNYPYTATSFTDFWRRWHMTLSGFFKKYVYIPLGGNRKGFFRTICHLFVIWALTGLWHGGRWNFLFWGLYYFAGLCLEKFVLRGFLEKLPWFIRHLLTLAGILLGWLLFAFDGSADYLSLPALWHFLGALLGAGGGSVGAEVYDFWRHAPFFAVAALGATPLPRRLYEKYAAGSRNPLPFLLPLAGLLLSAAYLADAGFIPFLYAGF